MVYRQIDADGYYIGETEATGDNSVAENWGDRQLIRPRWTGSEWVEGATDAEMQSADAAARVADLRRQRIELADRFGRALLRCEESGQSAVRAKFRALEKEIIKEIEELTNE